MSSKEEDEVRRVTVRKVEAGFSNLTILVKNVTSLSSQTPHFNRVNIEIILLSVRE